ncbi:MAG: DUF378 domain-containing protein [Firmicutes bacterium]|uniref:DUF378 domain-containing protein n=1 Tax=Melghirimyces thermohalophilus TaxID=1236220 RepID=A0A1G6HP95_9BACL|nr:DUF378 domain-containing protein [Melghirimyces thermohalophilus]MDA8351968.1 DUF378 domain-containing protein [Bacillota bacterium]SDB95685.1 hypothetical protein SAMN04488112_101104 [Melghirimyces thermohalophilus]
MSTFSRLALILTIVGAINWLLVGLFQWDLVSALFGGDSIRESSGFSRIIYALVGLAGIYAIRFLMNNRVPAK